MRAAVDFAAAVGLQAQRAFASVFVDCGKAPATCSGMNQGTTTRVRCLLPPQVVKDFAGVRDRVVNAILGSPQSVSFSEAMRQIHRFEGKALRKLPERK